MIRATAALPKCTVPEIPGPVKQPCTDPWCRTFFIVQEIAGGANGDVEQGQFCVGSVLRCATVRSRQACTLGLGQAPKAQSVSPLLVPVQVKKPAQASSRDQGLCNWHDPNSRLPHVDTSGLSLFA